MKKNVIQRLGILLLTATLFVAPATPVVAAAKPAFSADQIKSFTTDQIKIITPEQIATLKAAELAAFSLEQRAALSQTQTDAVNIKEWLKAVDQLAKAQAKNQTAAAQTSATTQANNQNTASALSLSVTPGRFHKINVLGDSITYGVGTSEPSKSFPSVLGQLLGASVNNYGTSCSRITDIESDISNPGSFVDRMYGMDRTADLVVVSGATNDFWYGDCPIGHPSDSQPSTFYGAMNTMFNYLKGAYPNALIVFVIPHRQSKGASLTSGPDRTTYSNFGTGTLNHYRKAIIDRCQAHNIPMLDEYSDPNFNLADDRDALLKYGSSAADGCHLNDAGAAYFAGRIKDFVISYDPATYFPAYCIYNDMDVPTAALPKMLGPTGFVMPNGSVLPYHPAAIPTAKSSIRDCYLAFHAAQYAR